MSLLQTSPSPSPGRSWGFSSIRLSRGKVPEKDPGKKFCSKLGGVSYLRSVPLLEGCLLFFDIPPRRTSIHSPLGIGLWPELSLPSREVGVRLFLSVLLSEYLWFPNPFNCGGRGQKSKHFTFNPLLVLNWSLSS